MKLIEDFVELKLKVSKLEEYTQYLAETLNKNIEYSEYLASQLHKVKTNFVEVSQDIKIPTFEEFMKPKSEIWKLYVDNDFINDLKYIKDNNSFEMRIIYEFADNIITEFIGLSRIDGYPIFKIVDKNYYNLINDTNKLNINTYMNTIKFNDIKKEPCQLIEDHIPQYYTKNNESI